MPEVGEFVLIGREIGIYIGEQGYLILILGHKKVKVASKELLGGIQCQHKPVRTTLSGIFPEGQLVLGCHLCRENLSR